MKAKSTHFFTWLLPLAFSALCAQPASGQGRVILNEYMPWPGNACGTPSEFVELLNMGPGPVNIGCYILTDGDFSITIPAGTVLAPGQFYVIAGQDFLPSPCTNINMNVTANLNWNTCNCTSAPIPSFGGGFLTDGGSANEQVVLLDPALNVVDAVARSLPVETSSTIVTSDLGGTCTSQSFNLDNMSIQYEIIGESAGRGNSFARRVDGACGWLKDTQQSGGSTNNTFGEKYTLDYSVFVTEMINCMGGSVYFQLHNSPASAYFPLDYILGYDANGDGVFTELDTYTTGIDYTPPTLEILNLPLGLYSINIGPRQGCDYRNFLFMVGPCSPLGIFLKSFGGYAGQGETHLEASLTGCTELSSLELEVSTDGIHFEWLATLPFDPGRNDQVVRYTALQSPGQFYRINMINRKQVSKLSPILRLGGPATGTQKPQLVPNPFKNSFQLSYPSATKGRIRIDLIRPDGQLVYSQQADVIDGQNQLRIGAENLPKGLYLVRVQHLQTGESQTFKALRE
jgi:hypothetical protein